MHDIRTLCIWDSSVIRALRLLSCQIIEQQILSIAKVVEDQLDGKLQELENLEVDDLDRLRERRIQQLKKQAEQKRLWLGQGHGSYQLIASEKEFFSVVKASERVVCHFFRENWPCKVSSLVFPP